LGLQHGRLRPNTNWKEVQKTAHAAIGKTVYVNNIDPNDDSERSSRDFIVTVHDPDGTSLQALQKAIREDFGAGSDIAIASIELAVDMHLKSKTGNSQELEDGFQILSRHFLPTGEPSEWNARAFKYSDKGKKETFFLSSAQADVEYPKEFTRYFLNEDDPVFYKVYFKYLDKITDKNDTSTARVLPKEEHCIRIEVTIQNEGVNEKLELDELDDLLKKGLPPLKGLFRFMTPTFNEWEEKEPLLLKRISKKLAVLGLDTYQRLGLTPLALNNIYTGRGRKLLGNAKLGMQSYKELDKRVADALKGINGKSKIGKYLVK
jgi:hypothetical protein